jgi:hypothetical protein
MVMVMVMVFLFMCRQTLLLRLLGITVLRNSVPLRGNVV